MLLCKKGQASHPIKAVAIMWSMETSRIEAERAAKGE